MENNIKELIAQNKYKLNEIEYFVLNYINNNFLEFKKMTIEELSQKTYCSKTSIFRLTKKLGFSGYSEFKVVLTNKSKINTNEIKESTSSYVTNAQLLETIEIADLEEILKCLNENQNFLLVGCGFSSIVKDYTKNSLYVKGKTVLASSIEDPGSVYFEQVNQADCVIGFSQSSQSQTFLNKINIAVAQKKKIIIVSAAENRLSTSDYLYLFVPTVDRNNVNDYVHNSIELINILQQEMK